MERHILESGTRPLVSTGHLNQFVYVHALFSGNWNWELSLCPHHCSLDVRCLHIFICFPGILHLEIFHCSSWILSILINGLCSLSLWTGEMQCFYVRISYSLWWASTHVLLLFLHMRFLFVIRVCSLALGMQSCCIAYVCICSHVKYASLRCFSSMTDSLANSCKLWIGWLL